MKRLLALLLCAVMLFSVLGAEAWAADGDTLMVYTKAGGRRSVAVGETFTYTYALKISDIYQKADRFWLDVVFDAECLEVVSAETYADSNEIENSANTTGDFRVQIAKDTTAFNGSIGDVVRITFRAKRGGTTYIRTLPQRIEVQSSRESDIYLIDQYRPHSARDALFWTYDYLGENVPNNATTKLNTSQDVVWFYVQDTDGNPIEAGQRFKLSGTDNNGKIVSLTAETDEYGFICFPKTPYGKYSLACDSTREDGSAYFVDDQSVNIPMVKGSGSNASLDLRTVVTARLLQPEDMIDLRVSLSWACPIRKTVR